MPQSSDPTAYADVRVCMDRALESEFGIRIRFESPKAAHKWRMNAYTVRSRDLNQSRLVWPPGHPSHGTSPYSQLVMYRCTEDGTKVDSSDMSRGEWLVVRPASTIKYHVEELSE